MNSYEKGKEGENERETNLNLLPSRLDEILRIRKTSVLSMFFTISISFLLTYLFNSFNLVTPQDSHFSSESPPSIVYSGVDITNEFNQVTSTFNYLLSLPKDSIVSFFTNPNTGLTDTIQVKNTTKNNVRHKILHKVYKVRKGNVENYIEDIAPAAIYVAFTDRIPPSVTIAQALLESGVGDSKLPINANNHFGVKCFKKSCKLNVTDKTKVWKNKTYKVPTYYSLKVTGDTCCVHQPDDVYNDRFKYYDSFSASLQDRVKLLKQKRYEQCFDTDDFMLDALSFVKGLKKGGYATDKEYVSKIMKLINTYNLKQYDEYVLNNADKFSISIVFKE